MSEPVFFPPSGPFSVAELAARLGGAAHGGHDGRMLRGVAALERAQADQLAFLEGRKLVEALARSEAGACLVAERDRGAVPAGTAAIVVAEPQRSFAIAVGLFHPGALRPAADAGGVGVSPAAHVHPEARLEPGVTVEPGAVVGAGAAVGAGTVIGPGAVIGPNVQLGRDCSIGPGATLRHALVGDRVIVHPGARIGQDGFGYVPGRRGHTKVPQIGRVVIQNDVEIGANTTIDRGALDDTVIGEGTKIDNLVQVAHNVRIGRHCIIAGCTGISGSCTVGDFAILAGGVGLADHVHVGPGAIVLAQSGVMHAVPAGERWMGSPAQPSRRFMRERVAIGRLTAARPEKGAAGREDGDE